LRQGENETLRVIHLTIVVDKASREVLVWDTGDEPATLLPRDDAPSGQMLLWVCEAVSIEPDEFIQGQRQGEEGFGFSPMAVGGDEKGERMDQVGRNAHKGCALGDRSAHARNIPIL
jgi:hypothetical protein